MMQPALTLTEQERLCFMQALHAVAWAVAWHKDQPGERWLELLRRLGNLLAVPAADWEFRAGPTGITEKFNQIGNTRLRLYFLRIIHDVHRREWMGLMDIAFFSDQHNTCHIRFQNVYNPLTAAIPANA
ncbi:hypothetical protein [Thiocapsa rosea]|uniref:Uncharacterized protein n=1 Tax=Thiocapsa rosea TaxID=69360 RepID=A0A495VBP9_9GAMM|nr:hypothetical protein [Thiocapsa rosea]RKT45845.1 hypothetical protein BDD21_3327 [Thiocapsa rosea]